VGMNFFRALVTCIHGNDFGWTDRVDLHVGSCILILLLFPFFSIVTFLIGRFSSLVVGGVCLR
jgi:hypothetical protein